MPIPMAPFAAIGSSFLRPLAYLVYKELGCARANRLGVECLVLHWLTFELVRDFRFEILEVDAGVLRYKEVNRAYDFHERCSSSRQKQRKEC